VNAVYLINFRKAGRAAFLGHLELVEIFKRAFRRAGLDLVTSQGFHPQPKISFLTALPLGVVSEDEYLRVVCPTPRPAREVADRLAAQLPEGLTIKGARILGARSSKIRPQAVVWRVAGERPLFTPGPPLHPEAILRYTDKKRGLKEYRLSEFIPAAEADGQGVTLTITLGLNGTPKPVAAAAALWGLDLAGETVTLSKLETILG
jgi:radical SAM-linked protein